LLDSKRVPDILDFIALIKDGVVVFHYLPLDPPNKMGIG
jgi:hypothetical protein